MLTQSYLKSILQYNPYTGDFTRLKKTAPNAIKGVFAGGTPCKHNGYIRISISGKRYLAHRLAWFYVYGEWTSQIDHINGLRHDNSLSNLRAVTNAENCKNKMLTPTNKTGIMGVHFHKGKFDAAIKVSRKKIHLGRFNNIFDAACARKSAEKKYGFHPNHGR